MGGPLGEVGGVEGARATPEGDRVRRLRIAGDHPCGHILSLYDAGPARRPYR